MYTLYLNDLLLRSKTYSTGKHDSNTFHKLRRAIVRLLYEGDSTYLRRGESMEAALISSQSSFTFYNYIKFDVWKSFLFGYVEWTRRQAMVKCKVSSGQQFRINRKNSWLTIIQISLDCHDFTSNALFLCPEYRLHFTSPHIFLTNPSLSISSLSISHTHIHTHTHTHTHTQILFQQ